MTQPSELSGPFVVRVTGLPASVLAGLSAPVLGDAVRAALAAERAVAREGQRLADELHDVVGTAGDALRPALVGLRRAVFRGRMPKRAEWHPEIRAALPEATAAAIESWLAGLAGRDRLATAVTETLAAETERTTKELLAVAADPVFRHGLAHSSPTLSAQWEKWLRRRTGRPARQVLVRLARYVSRAAAKTSPYSTFTAIGAGVWTTDGTDLLRLGPLSRPRTLLEAHGPVLRELTDRLSTCGTMRPAMLVRVNPSLTRVGERLVAIGPPPAERIAAVTALPEIADCVRLLGDGWERLDRLLARLSHRAPAAKIAAFVDRLVELGVLELRIPIDDQERDKFGALATWLRDNGSARWAPIADACAEVSRLVASPADVGEVDAHRVHLGRFDRAIGVLRTAAGLPGGSEAFLHEHAVYTEPVAHAGTGAWRAALEDLDHVRRWLAPHHPGLRMRLAVGAYVAQRFGAGAAIPFVAMHRDLVADLAHSGDPAAADLRAELWPTPATREFALPELNELAESRRRSLAQVLAAAPDTDGVVRVDPATLTSDMPAPASMAWFVQPDGDRLVLNTAMNGHGRGQARSLRLIADANGGLLPQALEPREPDPGILLADSSGEFGHPLNLRLPGRGCELDYPFTVHRNGNRPRTPLRELVVEHDPATGLARLRPAGGEVITPVHTGMMVEFGLPLALQILVGGLGVSPALIRMAQLLRPSPVDGQVTSAPRIEAGAIVLRRATWTAPADLVPRREPGESDAGLLLRLHRWLARHGIPLRCFVHADVSQLGKERKPLYVDFLSPWLLAMFERLIAGQARWVEFREVLPRLGDGPVAELIVETTAAAP